MTAPEPTQPLTDEELFAIRGAVERAELFDEETLPLAFSDRKKLLAEVDRLRAENTAMAAALERPLASPDEEFDAVREHALKVGDKRVTELLQAFDWLRTELAYSERIKDYVRKQHTDLEGAFDLVIKQCGKLRAERDSLAAALDQSGEGQVNG
jgi:hypothetical protein